MNTEEIVILIIFIVGIILFGWAIFSIEGGDEYSDYDDMNY